MSASLELRRVSRRFGSHPPALDGVTLTCEANLCTVITGPSGCGKTTLLRLIAGLDRPDEGEILIDGRSASRLAPHERNLAMVTQDAALYEHMSVRQNLEFPLRTRGADRAERRRRAENVAERLRMTPLLDRLPPTLSGGERRRAALGRMLVIRPAILLMDEPLAGLDPLARRRFRADLTRIREEDGPAIIWVTHDHEEALAVADRLVVMRSGRIHQVAPPMEVFRHPADAFVGTFIGAPPMNLLPVVVTEVAGNGTLTLRHEQPSGSDGWTLTLPASLCTAAPSPGVHLLLGIRPQALRVTDRAGASPLPATLIRADNIGTTWDLLLQSPAGNLLSVRSTEPPDARAGDRVTLAFDPAAAHLFPHSGDDSVPDD